jgi:hypothetical protein
MNWAILLPLIVILLSANLFSQTDPDYNNLWKEVNELDQKGLYSSAKEKVKSIRNWAVEQDNIKQKLKADLYQAKYLGKLNEDNIDLSIQYIEEALLEVKDEPLKSIAHSYLGGLWYHKSQIVEGSFLENEAYNNAIENFKQSIVNLFTLKNENANNWELFLETSGHSKFSHTSLADVLFERARKAFYQDYGTLKTWPEDFALLPQEFCSVNQGSDKSLFISTLRSYEKVLLEAEDTLRLLDAMIYRLQLIGGELPLETKHATIRSFYERYPSNQVLIRSATAFTGAFETYVLFKSFAKSNIIPQYEMQLVRRFLKNKERPILRHELSEVFSSDMPPVLLWRPDL